MSARLRPNSTVRSIVRVETAKNSLKVNIETIPQMVGIPAKSGKINAKTPKKLATTITGIDGKYHVSGRVDDSGVLDLVLVIAEDLVGAAVVEHRQAPAVPGDSQDILDQCRIVDPLLAPLALEPLLRRPPQGDGHALSGDQGQLAHDAVGLRVLDAQGHECLI